MTGDFRNFSQSLQGNNGRFLPHVF